MIDRMPLRGRSHELGTVLHAMREARAESASLVVVRGEPGIGKTALLRAAIEQGERWGFAVGRAAARDGDRVTPLASLGPALRSGAEPLIGTADFATLSELHEQPLWLAERLASLLLTRSAGQPLLVMIDDIQWSDPLSVFILRLLPARLATAPICWLIATRDDPGGPADTLAEILDGTVPVHRVDLGPLATDALLDMAADRLGHPAGTDLARLLAGTGGVPFLAAQVIDDASGASATMPYTLVDGVRRRLAPSSEQCRALIRAGAVLGAQFTLDDAARLLGRGVAELADALDEAVTIGLLTDDGHGVGFRHGLLHRAVYDSISPSVRRSLHQAFAEHCLTAGRGAAAAAPHVLATAVAGDDAAAEVLRTAALDLLDTMVVTSVVFIRQADALVAADRDRSPEMGRDVVRVLTLAGRHDEARRFADDILHSRALPPDIAATVQLTLAPRAWAAGERTELRTRTTDPRTEGAHPALRARLAAWAALAGPAASGTATPGTTARPGTALPGITATPGTTTLPDTTALRGITVPPGTIALPDIAVPPGTTTAAAPGADDTVAAAVRAVAEAERLEAAGRFPEAAARYRAAHDLTVSAVDGAGAPDPALVEVREAIATARYDLGAAFALRAAACHADSWHAAESAWAHACLLLGAGRLTQVQEQAEQALRLMDDLGDRLMEAPVRALLAAVALERGELDEARNQITAAGTGLPVMRARLDAAEGDTSALIDLARHSSPDVDPWWDVLLVEAALQAGAETAERLRLLAAAAPGAAGPAGMAALARGSSAADFEDARGLLTDAGRDLLAARADEQAGRVALADPDLRSTAVEALTRAHDRYAELGAEAGRARVLRLLHQAGHRRRQRVPATVRPVTGWAALTPMERRVARLIAAGHTNRSAAAALVLSANTVGTHLRAVYTKLAVNSRARLAAAVPRDDQPH